MNSAHQSDNPRRAIFPGTFDPLTNGHLDIIERSLSLFDELTIAVLENSSKTPLFTPAERVVLIQKQIEELSAGVAPRVFVKSFSGLLVEFAKSEGSHIVVRGLRAISDYDYEAQMALMNKSLHRPLETVFLIAREENSYISSSIVKQVALLNGDITKFVPPLIKAAIALKKNSS